MGLVQVESMHQNTDQFVVCPERYSSINRKKLKWDGWEKETSNWFTIILKFTVIKREIS